jgi:hypothetical protein
MPLIWCSISGHGFGHAAQVIPVLNELNRKVPGLTAILRTTVPARFFEGRLDCPFEISPAEQDIGCVQRDPLTIDYGETWAQHLRFFDEWEPRISDEVHAIHATNPTLVLSDISWLAIEAGAIARVPTVALCNLSWDQVLEPHLEADRSDQVDLLDKIGRAYAKTDVMIRLAPGLPMPAFLRIKDVGPIVQTPPSARPDLRQVLEAQDGERIILVGFGGIALESLPFERMEYMVGYRFLVSGPVPPFCIRCRSFDSIPIPFRTLLATADVIMTKPGYSTIVESVARCRPVLYVRRYNFVDEEPLVRYLRRYGRGLELSADDFYAGRWKTALDELQRVPSPHEAAPSPTGAAEAAAILTGYC